MGKYYLFRITDAMTGQSYVSGSEHESEREAMEDTLGLLKTFVSAKKYEACDIECVARLYRPPENLAEYFIKSDVEIRVFNQDIQDNEPG